MSMQNKEKRREDEPILGLNLTREEEQEYYVYYVNLIRDFLGLSLFLWV